MDNAEAFVKHVVKHAMDTCPADIDFFGKFQDKELPARLATIVDEKFARVRYEDAIEMLQAEIAKDPSKWEYPEVEFGTDLATEHERWLSETAFGRATFVYDYPKSIKAFYMRDNEDGRTVAAMDLLVPGVGELIGGSQREERMDVLLAKMKEQDLEPEDYCAPRAPASHRSGGWPAPTPVMGGAHTGSDPPPPHPPPPPRYAAWYLDLRKYGSVPHAGYGLGFERLVCYVTGTANIRDAIAFPRYPGSCEF